MRKIVLLILALCATMMVQAQIPAEVKTVLEKCGKVMENPRGLIIDMKMHMSMSVLSFNGTINEADGYQDYGRRQRSDLCS